MELTHNPTLLWFLAGYGVIMVVMGIFYSKKISSSEDFILAGKSLGAVVLMGTLIATWVGSGTITGGSNSLAYSFGIWPAMLQSVSAIVGIGLLFFIAERIRTFGKYTISEILETKYGESAKMLSVVVIVLAYVGIVSYQFQGFGFVLNVTTGIPVQTGTIIAAVLIIFLAAAGGLKAVAATDAIGAFVILIGLGVGIPFSISAAGGWANITETVPPSSLEVLGGLTPLQLTGYLIPSLFLLLGDQNMYQRLAASRGSRDTRIGSIGWLIGVIFIYPAVSIIAFSARVTFPDINPGMALIATTTILPTLIGGLLLAAAAAFIVTTGNSYLLSASTNITYDLYGKYINPKASDKQKLLFTRILIPVLGLLSYLLIEYFPSILSVQMYAYTVYAAGITPAVLAVFLWKKVTKAGGLASMSAGVITTLVWEIVLRQPYDLNSSVVSIPVAFAALIIVTLITAKKE
ncbi:solute:Na+ symporter, SSS family/sodium/proline symporter [Tindallia magadiensis]|uniref:Solute:Na+ symporter, SSS family/sodium/proline symporter n=1 Tax=Tindallia magadiensis TaxID=69895 RepID=A0A1I3C1C2_9FIRM|nr:sodium:solute symporter family protein [Tindallia magadiensis]SFH67781.1 solute:Na+ symporter, SSS family/sodium/proline symporter [Tindallia magadiensis]